MNPMALLQMKQRLGIFQQDHPRFLPFLNAVREQALKEGSVIDIKVTAPDGRTLSSNIRLTANDIETVRLLSDRQTEQ